MLVQRLRRWPNIKPTSPECVVLWIFEAGGSCFFTQKEACARDPFGIFTVFSSDINVKL